MIGRSSVVMTKCPPTRVKNVTLKVEALIRKEINFDDFVKDKGGRIAR